MNDTLELINEIRKKAIGAIVSITYLGLTDHQFTGCKKALRALGCKIREVDGSFRYEYEPWKETK